MTVIVGLLVGAAVVISPVLDFVAGVDLSMFKFITPEQALAITSGTAMLKALCVWVQKLYAWMTDEEAPA